MIKEDFQESIPAPKWIRPDLAKERGEIARVLKDFLGETANEWAIERLTKLIEGSPMVELTDAEWEALGNTDSFHNVRPGHIEDVERIAREYNEQMEIENHRNVDEIKKGFTENRDMEAPVILKNEKGESHLLSGNTRLMLARALQVRPQVVITNINSKLS